MHDFYRAKKRNAESFYKGTVLIATSVECYLNQFLLQSSPIRLQSQVQKEGIGKWEG